MTLAVAHPFTAVSVVVEEVGGSAREWARGFGGAPLRRFFAALRM